MVFFFSSSGVFALPLATIIILLRVVKAWTMGYEEEFTGWMLTRILFEIQALLFVLGSGLELLLSLGWRFLFGTEYRFPLFRVYLAAFTLIAETLGRVANLSGHEDHEATEKIRV